MSILTPKLGNLPLSDKFCAIKIACNFENLPHFCLNPPYFLDVNVGISAGILIEIIALFTKLCEIYTCKNLNKHCVYFLLFRRRIIYASRKRRNFYGRYSMVSNQFPIEAIKTCIKWPNSSKWDRCRHWPFWIADVAVRKCHQRQDEILIFFTSTILVLVKLFLCQ